MMRLTTKSILVLMVGGVMFTSCRNDKRSTGFTYMDDMYYSPALETYSADATLPNDMSAQQPVEGTIPRGYSFYEVPNTPEGYLSTKEMTEAPEAFTNADLKKGEELYGIFCSHCHGKKGDGNGILVEREKILGVPGYGPERLPDITPMSAYHVIMYGKGVMGSHASQLTIEERWDIIRYVWKLREDQTPDQPETETQS